MSKNGKDPGYKINDLTHLYLSNIHNHGIKLFTKTLSIILRGLWSYAQHIPKNTSVESRSSQDLGQKFDLCDLLK